MGKRGTKFLTFLSSLVLLIGMTFQVANAASLNDLLKQKESLNQRAQKYDSAAKNKQSEAERLSSQINSLESDIKETEKKIEDTGSQIEQTGKTIEDLTTNIAVKTKELDALKIKLNSSIREIYRASGSSDYEMLLGSNNLSDLVNQSKYVQAIEMQVKTVHGKVKTAKADLEKEKSEAEAKKAELDQLKAQQEAHRSSADYQKSQKDKLLGMTVEQKEAYTQEAQKARQEAARVEEQIRQALASLKKGADGTFGSGPGVGTRVKRGDYVGTQGSTGFSTGDHVHFEVDTVQPGVGYTNPWPYINNGTLSWPLKKFVITQDYWEFWSPSAYPSTGGYHMGIDIAGPLGSPVFAPADGLVVLNRYFGGYGNAWAMKVDDGPYVLLGHLR